jgi:hypothetical protein
MTVNGPIRKAFALVVAAAAVTAAITVGVQPIASGAPRQAASATSGRGNPNAAPPVLPAATRSELTAIRLQEAREARAFSYRLPLTARYSDAEMDTYAAVCGAGC